MSQNLPNLSPNYANISPCSTANTYTQLNTITAQLNFDHHRQSNPSTRQSIHTSSIQAHSPHSSAVIHPHTMSAVPQAHHFDIRSVASTSPRSNVNDATAHLDKHANHHHHTPAGPSYGGLSINRHYLTGDEQQLSDQLQNMRLDTGVNSSAYGNSMQAMQAMQATQSTSTYGSPRSASISPVSSAAATPLPYLSKKKKRKRRFILRRLRRKKKKSSSPLTGNSLHSAHRPVSSTNSATNSMGGNGPFTCTSGLASCSSTRNSGKRNNKQSHSYHSSPLHHHSTQHPHAHHHTHHGHHHKTPNPLFRSLKQALSNGRLKYIHRFQLLILNSGLLPIRKQTTASILPQAAFDLSTDRFEAHLQLIRRYPILVKAEFFQLERSEMNLSQKQANRSENLGKNCHPRLLPFDCNRVLLRPIPDEPGSDYVNASHVDSLMRPNAYIAAAGPHEHTVGDFWRMIWEQKSYVIVMLTKVLDFIRVMCCQYWPLDANKPTIYDWMEVVLLAEEPLADFKIRTFRIRRISYAEWLQNRRKLALEAQAQAAAAPNAPPPEPPGPKRPMPSEQEVTEAFERLKRFKSDDNVGVGGTAAGLNQDRRARHHDVSAAGAREPPVNTGAFDEFKFGDWEQSGEFRIVYQFHYENWPVHTCPYADSLLQFRRRVKVYMNELNSRVHEVGPIVVHCSDGSGRTGAFLVIDANIELAKEDNVYNIFGYAKSLRSARRGMIETLSQYKFVYDCLEESKVNGQTWFPLSDLISKMKEKSIKDPHTKLNQYQKEYDKIVKLSSKFSIGDCAGGHRIENRGKNRDVTIIPPDSDRPYLSTFQNNDSTDFVNAVFIDGYTRPREYMVTEWPMAHTIPDCWSLIYDHDCNSVVVLATPEDNNKFPMFWPTEKEKKKKFGPVFTIECLAFNHYANIKSWMFKINKKVVSLTELMSNVSREPKTAKFFQITCWPTGHKVPSSTNALVELMDMVERWRQRTSYGPVCVVSADGKGRAGVYCAANVAIEQVVQHGEVDVFQAVKTVRRHRPQLVENMTEYKYCYDVILHYVLHYLNHGS